MSFIVLHTFLAPGAFVLLVLLGYRYIGSENGYGLEQGMLIKNTVVGLRARNEKKIEQTRPKDHREGKSEQKDSR